MKFFITWIIMFSVFWTLSQANESYNFHKIYNFGDTTTIITNIFTTDSVYYFYGNSGKGLQRSDLVFGKLNLDGEINAVSVYSTQNEFNKSYGSLSQLQLNFRNNFVLSYGNLLYDLGVVRPNITEIDNSGLIINNLNIDLTNNDTLLIYDFDRLIVSNNDSTYYLSTGYNIIPGGSIELMESGSILSKINYSGDTLWNIRFSSSSSLNKIFDIELMLDGTVLLALGLTDFHVYSPQNDWEMLRLLKINDEGIILADNIVSDSGVEFYVNEMLLLEDGSIILPGYVSKISPVLPMGQERLYSPSIFRIKNNEKLWVDTLNSNYFPDPTIAGVPIHLIHVNDSVYGGAYTYTYDTIYDPSIWFTQRVFESVRMFNKTIGGQTLWSREYLFWQVSDTVREPEYSIMDFEKTFDGGFISCGFVVNTDSLQINSIGQFGYVLKTNCLGFLGSPQSAYSYQSTDSLNILFSNHSVQAGSYLWVFGDGDSLRTNEYLTQLNHVYSSSGSYFVKLIAYGCNGEADTLVSSILVPESPQDSITYVGDGTLLSIFPNPVNAGESIGIYVGDINGEEAMINLTDYTGKIVFQATEIKGKTNYFFPVQVASGIYLINLVQNGKFMETERVLIK